MVVGIIILAVIIVWGGLMYLSKTTDNYVGDPPTAEDIERMKQEI